MMFVSGFMTMEETLKVAEAVREGHEVEAWLNLNQTSDYYVPISIDLAKASIRAHQVVRMARDPEDVRGHLQLMLNAPERILV